MTDLERCRRLLDDAIQEHRRLTDDQLVELLRVAGRLRTEGFPEGARSIEDRIRELGHRVTFPD